MSEVLRSVGLDVGTTSTQMVVSELTVENRAGSFSVPEMEIARRHVIYQSPVHFTPLLRGELVDADGLRQIVDEEYRKAGIRKSDVDTGAIIITGETSRKENARAVLEVLAEYAGDFVVAAAGPDLESVLAAKGAGAVEFSRRTGKTVLHMDIGGGTSNLAWIRDGKIIRTGCLNVGGRLLKIDPDGRLTYVSAVLDGLFFGKVGDYVNQDEVRKLADQLARALETAAGIGESWELLEKLETKGTAYPISEGIQTAGDPPVISFSGGVADCIDQQKPWLAYGDMGPELGKAIRESRLCRGEYVLGSYTIRATVIGAGSHSAQLSGSTVYRQNVVLPQKNLPVMPISGWESPTEIRNIMAALDAQPVFFLEGFTAPTFDQVSSLADSTAGWEVRPLYLAMETDAAKALGQQLALRMGEDAGILCIDRVRLGAESYLDVGQSVGPALPVVVKTLILER